MLSNKIKLLLKEVGINLILSVRLSLKATCQTKSKPVLLNYKIRYEILQFKH